MKSCMVDLSAITSGHVKISIQHADTDTASHQCLATESSKKKCKSSSPEIQSSCTARGLIDKV